MIIDMKKVRAASKWLLLIIWMVIIFVFSSQNGEESSGLSGRVTDTVIKMLKPGNAEVMYDTVHYIVRKGAHFTEYAILGVLWSLALHSLPIVRRHSLWIAFVASAAYAVFDEIHQSFVSGRTPAVKDVMIDSAGALFGIIVFGIITCLVLRRRRSGDEMATSCSETSWLKR